VRSILGLTLLALAGCWSEVELGNPVLITREEQREAAVGHAVTVQGVVSDSKVPTIVGVEVNAGSPSLRGMPAVATGWLRKRIVTKEDLDREDKKMGGISAHAGPGTYYSLEDADGKLAKARRAPE
jgi:hypothetical protein